MTDSTPTVAERITAYLAGGGLFNPEYANHDAVRDLLIDARSNLAAAQEALKAAEELAERSTRRMVEMSEPGFIGAFAARDAAIDRAQRAEERAERAERDAERYRKARRNGGFFFSSDRMTDAEIDARIDELPDYVDDISSGELSAAIARGKE